MLHSSVCGEDCRDARRPYRIRETTSNAHVGESCTGVRHVPSRKRDSDTDTPQWNVPLQEGLTMTLTSAHTTHLHHIFYALCSERRWSLGLPTSFDFGYLDADNRRVQARIVFDGSRPTILLHPLAFKECRGHLLKGLLHHEMCHYLLGSEAGHGPQFTELEEGWQSFYLFKSESNDFARTLNRRRPRYVLSCPSCGIKFERDIVPVGRLSCRGCCEKYSNGDFNDKYNLHIGVVSMSES